jgi:phosphate transport system permease protein
MASPSSSAPEQPVDRPRPLRSARGLSDRLFGLAAHGGGVLVLLIMTLVGLFLAIRGAEAIGEAGPSFLTEQDWEPNSGRFGIAAVLFGTVTIAGIAILVALPLALGTATYIAEYAPAGVRNLLVGIVDLMAAIPSVVYGLWGGLVLGPFVRPVWEFLNQYLGWIPLFADPVSPTGRVMLTVGVVLAVMILPIITAICREVFLQTPRLHEEAALALGATQWEMVRMAVLPFARSGIVSAAMLGLGRALGETMAVLMILSPGFLYSINLVAAGQQQTIAANIAAQFPEANQIGVSTLIATGLALFVITLAVNMAARAIVARRKDFSGAN